MRFAVGLCMAWWPTWQQQRVMWRPRPALACPRGVALHATDTRPPAAHHAPRNPPRQFQEEEREKNEANLITLVSDSISAMVFFVVFVRDNDARQALFSTIGRLFAGLSDIAKAVLIILVADTLLGYHSEEGASLVAVVTCAACGAWRSHG
jgi:hypothetical protein